jgi:hypothetical protein
MRGSNPHSRREAPDAAICVAGQCPRAARGLAGYRARPASTDEDHYRQHAPVIANNRRSGGTRGTVRVYIQVQVYIDFKYLQCVSCIKTARLTRVLSAFPLEFLRQHRVRILRGQTVTKQAWPSTRAC